MSRVIVILFSLLKEATSFLKKIKVSQHVRNKWYALGVYIYFSRHFIAKQNFSKYIQKFTEHRKFQNNEGQTHKTYLEGIGQKRRTIEFFLFFPGEGSDGAVRLCG